MNQKERFLKFRQGLHALYLPIYDGLCAWAEAQKNDDGSYWAPIWGLRDATTQDNLYSVGRTTQLTAKRVTNAQAWESAHNFGCASDWVLFNSSNIPVWLTSRWGEYQAAIAELKGDWGGNFTAQTDVGIVPAPDKPHNQLKINIRWGDLRPVVLTQGSAKAFELIAASLD